VIWAYTPFGVRSKENYVCEVSWASMILWRRVSADTMWSRRTSDGMMRSWTECRSDYIMGLLEDVGTCDPTIPWLNVETRRFTLEIMSMLHRSFKNRTTPQWHSPSESTYYFYFQVVMHLSRLILAQVVIEGVNVKRLGLYWATDDHFQIHMI